MRAIIAGGGTGGHLFPGVAIAEELRARGHQVSFVGTARGIEARALPKEGLELDLIDVGGLKGGGALGLIRGLLRLPRALFQTLAILGRRRPDLVVGVGGYASGPMVAAAWLRGVPTAILEQNSVPGITNRILGRLVRAVFASFEESRRFFPPAKVELLGNPIRARVRGALAAASQHDHNALQQGVAASQHKGLLVLGGSQGAKAVNQLVADAVEGWASSGVLAEGGALSGLRLVHQTGATDAEPIAARYAALATATATATATAAATAVTGELRATPFIDDMASAYAAADLIVARAGATSLAEITAIGRAAILIPFPFAADDHQTGNARALAAQGAAILMPQATASAATLGAAIVELLADEPRRRRMSEAARALGRPEAAAAITDRLLQIAAPRASGAPPFSSAAAKPPNAGT